jgi:hypothetical protein
MVDPESRTVTVFTSPIKLERLTIDQTLGGGAVLPGFAIAVRDLFADLDPMASASP